MKKYLEIVANYFTRLKEYPTDQPLTPDQP